MDPPRLLFEWCAAAVSAACDDSKPDETARYLKEPEVPLAGIDARALAEVLPAPIERERRELRFGRALDLLGRERLGRTQRQSL